MDKMRIWRIAKKLLVPFILSLATIFSILWIISGLQRPEYTAVVIAVMGFAFTLWLEAFREMSNRIRNKLGLLSQLRIELTQNSHDVKSFLETCEQMGEASSYPAPLKTHAWLVATSSPYFTKIDTSMVNELISIYDRLDAANYYADIFKLVTYSPQGTTLEANQTTNNSRRLYLEIVRGVSGHIDSLLAIIEKQIEKLGEY
jgi:hypothetical protein